MEKLKKYLPLVAGILAIVAVVMMFLPAVEFYGATNSGLQVTFGMEGWSFSFMSLLTYVLALVGAVLCFMAAKKDSFILNIVAAIVLVVAAIFFFMAPNFAMGPGGITAAQIGCSAGIGAVLGGVCSILAAVGIAVPAVLNKLGK